MTYKLIIVNFFTLIRVIGTILLVPIYNLYGGYYASILIFVSYLTDIMDGFLARKLKASTFFGSLFDGAADKLFTIMNFIILYLITPYAIIPIIIEILIVLVQFMKYFHNMNVKSNMVGKSKVWVLAFCVIVTFLVSDIKRVPFLSLSVKNYILNLNHNTLYLSLLMPAIIMEILTLLSYINEALKKNKNEDSNDQKKVAKGKKWDSIKYIWLNPEYYNEHKDDVNLKKSTKIGKS